MITKYISGDTFNEKVGVRKIRRTTRAFIRRESDHKILLMHAEVDDMYMLPGGGLEMGETTIDCVVRECREEAGLIIKPIEEDAIRVREYYKDRMYEVTYYKAEIIGETERALTGYEIEQRMTPVWVDEDEGLELFELRLGDPVERRAGLAVRELTAYSHFVNLAK